MEEQALPVKNVDDAVGIRNHILLNMKKASQTIDLVELRKLRTIVVAGGATGVEILASIKCFLCFWFFLNTFAFKLKTKKMHRLDIRIDWEAFVKGDERIFSLVYETFFNALFNYGCKYTRNTELIEDAIQDLFVRFWKNRERLTEPPSLKNYLFKAFRNHMSDRMKAAGRYVLDNLGDHHPFELVPSFEDEKVTMEDVEVTKAKLSMAMVRLTDRQREAIFLRFYEGFSYPEIADMMGITVKATYKLMARSIDVVREGLGGSNINVFLILFKVALSSK